MAIDDDGEKTESIVEEANKLYSFPFSNGNSERILYRPSTCNAYAYSALSNSDSLRPLSASKILAIHSVACVISAIVLLFLLSCPPAIIFVISFCVVFSVYGMQRRWGIAHVIEKAIKVYPFFAQQAKVCRSSRIVLIRATMLHILPSRVFLGIAHVMLSIYGLGNLTMKAAARLCITIGKIATANNNCCSAFTLTQPLSPTSDVIFRATSNYKSTKSKPRKIHNFSHLLCLE